MKLLSRFQTYLYGLVLSMLVTMQSAYAAGECSVTGGFCQKFVDKMSGMFTEVSDLSLYLVLALLGIAFIFFAFYKISGASKRA